MIKSIYVCCDILMSFGSSWAIFCTAKALNCGRLGFTNSSNDDTNPTTLLSFSPRDGVAVVFVPLASVWAVDGGAELTAIGASLPAVVVWLLGALTDGAVAIGVGVIRTLTGLAGLIGLATFVMFVNVLVH